MSKYPEIRDCSLLSDNRTTAIVEPNCSISWMCAPRVDSAPIFAHLLDTENVPTKAGIFQISQESGENPRQSYVGDTLVLRSHFSSFHVTDYLDTSRGRTKHQAGRTDLIRVVEGSGVAKIIFAPRLNFGRSITKLVVKERGLIVTGGNDLMCLRSPNIDWEISEIDGSDVASAVIDLDAFGGRLKLELRCGTANIKSDVTSEPERRSATLLYWQKWVDKLSIPRLATEEVKRSAVTLKALCYRPTGAIIAAATMSLPEDIGGVRNWDYRYCWLRDAALTAASLVRVGSHSEAMAYLDWLLGVVEMREGAENLQPLYNVSGKHLGPEAEISDLSGFRGSQPVRINNGADTQVQLDVFGPIVDLIHLLSVRGEALATKHWDLVKDLVHAVKMRWKEADCGIWEIRSSLRHYTYTKLMCWVAVDRAIELADDFTGEVDPEWLVLKNEIADSINENSYKKEINAYSCAYDETDIDASVLALGLYGFIEMNDPKFVGTIKAVEENLLVNNTVYRYKIDKEHEDGLAGDEGGWNILTLWLVKCYWASGRNDDARKLFQVVRKNIGATGLMSEQVDPNTLESLGNHPQAYSHLAYIDAVITMSENSDID
jgi:trehalose 6-phosphate phosphatase